MYKCKTCGREFEEFHYQRVFWSGDSISVCPYCRTNVYEGEFEWKEEQTDERFENMEAVGIKKIIQ